MELAGQGIQLGTGVVPGIPRFGEGHHDMIEALIEILQAKPDGGPLVVGRPLQELDAVRQGLDRFEERFLPPLKRSDRTQCREDNPVSGVFM